MRSRTHGRRRRRRLGPAFLLLFLLALMGAGAAAGWLWWQERQPNREYVTPEYMAHPAPIMVDGAWTGKSAAGRGDGLKIPLELARELFGEGVWYEETTDSVVLTTPTHVLHLKPGDRNAALDMEPFELRFAAEKGEDGTLYLPLAPLTELFGLRAETGEGTGIVTLRRPGDTIERAEVTREITQLRSGPSIKEPIVEDLQSGDVLAILEEREGWYFVQAASGRLGYVDERHVALRGAETVSAPPSRLESSFSGEDFAYWNLTGKKINLTWEAVYNVPPDPDKIGSLPGVNVISPTWFELTDGEGNIRSKADARFVQWAHDQGMQVWALFSNSFDPDLTREALSTHERRMNMIAQLLAYAQTFNLQGINIDFENVYLSEKEALVQFVREMTPLMHAQGLVVSIDVTPKSSNEMWSAFLDREKLGRVVDFMMVMAYDEHWASSPKAGSVSSLPWAENAIARILREDKVPPDKLILGVPFYARLWTIDKDGKVSSRALGMEAVRRILRERKLEPVLQKETGQHFAEYKEGENTYQIWIEDEHSLKARIGIVKKYGLAGIASWQRGFAAPDIWDVLDRELQSLP